MLDILKVEEGETCPLQKIVGGKTALGLLVEYLGILAIRKPQFAYYKLRFSRLFDTY